jgi:hypothetical protein
MSLEDNHAAIARFRASGKGGLYGPDIRVVSAIGRRMVEPTRLAEWRELRMTAPSMLKMLWCHLECWAWPRSYTDPLPVEIPFNSCSSSHVGTKSALKE